MRHSKHGLIAIAFGAVIFAATLISPALGGPSLKKLVKKEVAKQLAKATGPPGANGINGTNGADGTARAYARVINHTFDSCVAPVVGCTFNTSKGIASVTRAGTGIYCVTAPGIGPASVPAAVTVHPNTTTAPAGNASAMDAAGLGCGAGVFTVHTQRQPITAVRNAADTGSVDVAGNAELVDDVSFTIVIP